MYTGGRSRAKCPETRERDDTRTYLKIYFFPCDDDVERNASRRGAGSGWKRLLDSALPNVEGKLRALITKLKEHGRVLLVVDQPATIGALPVAVARAEGIAVAYLPGLAMRRIADLHAGEAKTDARDAYIIAKLLVACRIRCAR